MMKKISLILLCSLLSLACIYASGAKENKTDTVSSPTFTSFTDSLGRKIELSKAIDRVIPGNVTAQLYLYAIAPDKLISLSQKWPEGSDKYITKDALSLPVTGSFSLYASSLDYKAIKNSNADLVIVMGDDEDSFPGLSLALDTAVKETGVQFAYLKAPFAEIPNTLARLAKLLSVEKSAEPLISYANDIFLPLPNPKIRYNVYYSEAIDGLTPVVPGSSANAVFDNLGISSAVNANFSGPMTIKEIASLNPDKLFLSNSKAYKEVTENDSWKIVDAVRDGEVYFVPSLPYNILGTPSSVQCLIGFRWLENVVYQTIDSNDTAIDISIFFDRFFHANVDPSQISTMLELKK